MDKFIDRNVLIEDIYVFQRLEEKWNITDVVEIQELSLNLFSYCAGKGNECNTADLNEHIKDIFDHLMRETVDKAGKEPFKYPHWLVYIQV